MSSTTLTPVTTPTVPPTTPPPVTPPTTPYSTTGGNAVNTVTPNQNNGSISPTTTQSGYGNPTGNGNYGPTQASPYGFSTVNGVVTPNPTPSVTPATISTSNPTTPIGTSTGNANVDALKVSYDAQATAAKTFSDAVTNIENGTTPLSAGEQAQVDGLKQQFQQLVDQQTLTNTGATGTANIRGYQGGAAEYDPTFQQKTIGSVMSAGAQKIATLQIQEASAVASLTQALQNNDIANLKTAWDALTTAQTATQEGLKAVIADTQGAMKDAAVQSVLSSGVTNPKDILATLQAKGYADISSSDIASTIKNLSPDAADILKLGETAKAAGASDEIVKAIMSSGNMTAAIIASGNSLALPDINAVLKQATANNAPDKVKQAIVASKNLSEALMAAGKYASTLTGDMGEYYQYVQDAQAKGQVPSSYSDWENKNAYNKAYNTAAGSAAGKATVDAQNSGPSGLNKDGISFWADAAASGVNTNSLLPSLGMGSAAVAVKQALLQKIADNANTLGISGSEFAAALTDSRAKQATYTKLQTQGSMLAANEQKATADMNLVKQLGAKMDANSWQLAVPALNDWLRTGQVSFTGNADVNNFLGALTTTMTAYAKVVSGQTTGQGVTDAANKETSALIKAGLSSSAVNSYFDNVAAPEMKNTVDSYNTSLKSLFGAVEQANQNAGQTGGLGSTSQNLIQAENDAEDAVAKAAQANTALQPQIAQMLDTNNPATGQPYTYQDIQQILGL